MGMVSAVLQGDLMGWLQRLRGRGGRRGAPARHCALSANGGGRPNRPERHADAHVPARTVARGLHRPGDTGADRGGESRLRLPVMPARSYVERRLWASKVTTASLSG